MSTVTDRYAQVLLIAVVEAAKAPSAGNSQPWRWRIAGPVLELRAVDARRPPDDPGGRLLALSCGAVLHHARVALAAGGWSFRVERLPDPGEPALLARVTLTGCGAPDPRAGRLLDAARHRRTDRRPYAVRRVPDRVLHRLVRAVRVEEARLRPLHTSADGLVLVLCGPAEAEPAPGGGTASWLRGGEALSALLLAATAEGLATATISTVPPGDVTATENPYLLVRAGYPPPGAGLPATPRRDLAEIAEIIG